jgi:uncharacterized protein (TIGR02757 family)
MAKPFNKDVAIKLEGAYQRFHRHEFIDDDPISIPHAYEKQPDIEIAAFFAAIFAWGQRKTILAKTKELLQRMDNAPYDFILHHQEGDLKRFLGFKHRTFNESDALFFISFFRKHFESSASLETAFWPEYKNGLTVEEGLDHFYAYAFSQEHERRTRKHLSTPAKGSACKRLNMFLRWMVRQDNQGIDFGLWKRVSTAQLICPLDVHAEQTARQLGLLERPKADWAAAIELSANLKVYDEKDPVRFDFALYGMGLDKRKKFAL